MSTVYCEETIEEPVLKRFDIDDIFRHVLDREAITTVFQPIASLRDGKVLAYEALSRGPAGSPLRSPSSLIEAARRCGRSMELESLFFRKAMENADKVPDGVKLFVNIDPAMLRDAGFRNDLSDSRRLFDVDCGKIVFELTERENIGDIKGFCRLMAEYRSKGCGIAVDDVGSGYSGLNRISSLRPEYIKLDMELIRGVDRDPVKQAMVKCMGDFAAATDTTVIAEGIETQEEMSALVRLGIPYGQGYLIQKPSEFTNLPLADISAAIFRGKTKNRIFGLTLPDFYTRHADRLFAGLLW